MENDEPDDPLPEMLAMVDQWVEFAPHLARAMATEYNELVKNGVGLLAAAVIIGNRYKLGS